MHFSEGLHHEGGGKALGNEIDVGTAGELVEEFEHHTEHVCERQHADVGQSRMVGNVILTEAHVGREVLLGDHNALGATGRTGGIVDDSEVVHVLNGEEFLEPSAVVEMVGVFRFQFGVDRLPIGRRGTLEDRHIVELDKEVDVRHFVQFETVDDPRPYKHSACVGVLDEFVDTLGGEIRKDADGDSAVGFQGEEGDSPVGAVASADSDFIAGFDALLAE